MPLALAQLALTGVVRVVTADERARAEHAAASRACCKAWRHAADDDAARRSPRSTRDVQPELPPRSRGVIALLEENCTVCMLCARECPDWCIYIDSHKETIPARTEGGRERSRNVLDRFAIDFSLCMYCGICIEVCPFDALFWSPEFEYAELRHPRPDPREGPAARLDVRPCPPPPRRRARRRAGPRR